MVTWKVEEENKEMPHRRIIFVDWQPSRMGRCLLVMDFLCLAPTSTLHRSGAYPSRVPFGFRRHQYRLLILTHAHSQRMSTILPNSWHHYAIPNLHTTHTASSTLIRAGELSSIRRIRALALLPMPCARSLLGHIIRALLQLLLTLLLSLTFCHIISPHVLSASPI